MRLITWVALLIVTATTATAYGSEGSDSGDLEAEIASLKDRLNSIEAGLVPLDSCPTEIGPRWIVSVDYLNWRLHRRGLDFAIPTSDTALAAGVGEVENLTFGRDSGMRVGVSYLTKMGWEIGFRYTNFDTQNTASAAEPAGGNLWATRSHPAGNEEARTADAFGSFNQNLYDLEMKHFVPVNQFTSMRVMGGFRWADIDQNFRVNL